MNISEVWNGFVEFGQSIVSTITLKTTGVEIDDSTATIVFFAVIALVVVGILANKKRGPTRI